jgi:phytoene dehydrogenase-like protein
MDYDVAQRIGHQGQLEYLDRLIEEEWWRRDFTDVRVLAKRTAQQWGSDYNLYGNSMNPVMTARFMRQGRVRHRSPHVRGLYLAGSSTHPGQWVSFCMMSGILAADCIIEDRR